MAAQGDADADAAVGGQDDHRWVASRRTAARARFVAIAADLIGERGLDRFTLADVATLAGCSRTLAAHYFANKAELVEAAVTDLLAGPVPQSRELGLEPLLAAVKNTLIRALNQPSRVRAQFVVLGDVRHSSPFGARVAEFHADRVEAIRKHLEAAAGAGEIRAEVDIDRVSRTILATTRGIVFLGLGASSPTDLLAQAEGYVGDLRRMLCADPRI